LSGIACCRAAVEKIYSLFDKEASVRIREIDQRHVLQAELLKIPLLRMSPEWEPGVDLSTLEHELLELIRQGPVDWKQAFELHCQQGDHVATGLLLELDVWPSAAEQAELQRVRTLRIQECREALEQELAEMLRTIAEAAELGLLAEPDRIAFESWVQRLSGELSKTVDFVACYLQLGQIRLGIERRRQRELERVEKRLAQLRPAGGATPLPRKESTANAVSAAKPQADVDEAAGSASVFDF
jgi:hypothetical protein